MQAEAATPVSSNLGQDVAVGKPTNVSGGRTAFVDSLNSGKVLSSFLPRLQPHGP